MAFWALKEQCIITILDFSNEILTMINKYQLKKFILKCELEVNFLKINYYKQNAQMCFLQLVKRKDKTVRLLLQMLARTSCVIPIFGCRGSFIKFVGCPHYQAVLPCTSSRLVHALYGH